MEALVRSGHVADVILACLVLEALALLVWRRVTGRGPRPADVLAILEPLYPGGLDQVIPGSNCIANAYTSNHEALSDPATGTLRAIALHGIDAVGVVHAVLLRMQTLLLPFKVLVLSGH